MNCINCKWAIQWDESMQCKRANPDIRDCAWFEKINRYELEGKDKLKQVMEDIDIMSDNKLKKEEHKYMIRVRDNINLEELERFGFKRDSEGQYMINDLDIFVGTDDDDRELVLDFGFNNENIDLLFDLFQAGIVEKKDEKTNKTEETMVLNTMIRLMADELSTPVNGINWVIDYYNKKAKEELNIK